MTSLIKDEVSNGDRLFFKESACSAAGLTKTFFSFLIGLTKTYAYAFDKPRPPYLSNVSAPVPSLSPEPSLPPTSAAIGQR